ncbi:MAG: hypothetical protein ABIZ81_10065 [Opitutaceae bacterium]
MSSANSSSSRDDQLAAVLASPIPRVLPREVRRAILSQAAPLSFGIFGALFGGFGLVFVWIFFPRNIAQEWRLNSEETARAAGFIHGAADTWMTVNKEKVSIYLFEFRNEAGAMLRGQCFTTGRRWQTGDIVDIIYLRENPAIARPDGARLSSTNMGSMIVVLFPLGGAGLALWVAISRRRTVNAFVNGRVIEAFVTDIEHTQTIVNDYSVYKITFEQPGLAHEPIILRHWKPKVVAFLQTRRETQQPVFLLADPRNPTVFFLPETL